MSLRQDNVSKKWRPCLKCGRRILTDRCHRFCRKCTRGNNRVGTQKTAFHVSGELGSDELKVLLGE